MMNEIELNDTSVSSDPSLTRQEFIKKIVKGAALTGGLVAAPKVIDKFLVPAAYAATSSSSTQCSTTQTANDTTAGGGPDLMNSQGGKDNLFVTCANPVTDVGAGNDRSPCVTVGLFGGDTQGFKAFHCS